MHRHVRRALAPGILFAVLVAVAGCSVHNSFQRAETAAELGDWDDAVIHYMEAVEGDPTNIRYKAALMRARIKASQDHFEAGKKYHQAGVLERALVELQQAVQLDPTNQYAETELEAVRQQILALREGRDADSIAEMKRRNAGALPQPPVLDPRSDEPIDLEFPNPTPIFQIYKALGDAFGINVLFDQNLKDQDITITLEDVTAERALEHLMRTAGHFYKVVDPHSIIVAADTPQNRKTYEDLVIQTFFLSNAEVKDMMTILRSLIDSRRIASNDQLNAIILRDTADKVKVAERIIQANDKARAEVVVDVELLQIDSSRARELGLALSQYSVNQSLDLGGEDTPLRVSDLEFLNQSNWILSIPNFIYNFMKTSTDAQLLAQPQLRSSEGEKARAVIGDRVPIPVTSFNTANTVGSNIVPVTSFQYQDVGITIEIEPRVHHNQEITLKMRVEVSNISGFIQGSGGQQQPRIGTRTIESTIRLRDGETNLIAGLIRTDDSNNEQGLPGLSDIPVVGHLFSNKANDHSRTDLILTLTPHIVRQAEITEADLLPIWVGTEANITFRGDSPRLEADAEGPFDGPGGSEEVEELMRRRLERLPQGLRDQGGEEPPPPPAGIDLVPGGFEPPEPEPEPEPEEEEFDSGVGLIGDEGQADLAPPEGIVVEPPAGGWALASWSAAAGDGGRATAARTAAAPPPAVRVWMVPQALRVAAGERFEVRLLARAERPLSHLPLTVEYDPALLAVESVEGGDFLGPAGQVQLLTDSTRPGRLVIGASRLGEIPGVTGDGTVARLTLRGLAAGDAALSFRDSQALDAALEPLSPFQAAGARITVAPASEPPERLRPRPRTPRAEAGDRGAPRS
jgi:general secretion pathway protein D